MDKIWEQGKFLFMKVVKKTLYNVDLYGAVNKGLREKKGKISWAFNRIMGTFCLASQNNRERG